MIKLSRMTDYAIVVMAQMSTQDGLSTASRLAADTGVPEPSVAKLLKKLAREGLVKSYRGVNGGYALERDAKDINVEEIIAALDGPIAIAACVDGGADDCVAENLCPVRGNWNKVNDAIRNALQDVSLADLIETQTSCACGKAKSDCGSAETLTPIQVQGASN